ncbi:hypothetical protein BRCON_0353 [Candidatus Sumerlaea chitinivorans]|uniref:Uncharacterized protein n=1 Tax=Sumerlaea chitinivorans TaxID=2250252 RepID=A0A2Z4Y204_SUMC1|nr:hypothetical protein BRCON_0353 [Candidatus Sumerlaea chitinivorans]
MLFQREIIEPIQKVLDEARKSVLGSGVANSRSGPAARRPRRRLQVESWGQRNH